MRRTLISRSFGPAAHLEQGGRVRGSLNGPRLDMTLSQNEPVTVRMSTGSGDVALTVEPRMICVETPTRVTWGDEVADGWLARNLRPSAMG